MGIIYTRGVTVTVTTGEGFGTLDLSDSFESTNVIGLIKQLNIKADFSDPLAVEIYSVDPEADVFSATPPSLDPKYSVTRIVGIVDEYSMPPPQAHVARSRGDGKDPAVSPNLGPRGRFWVHCSTAVGVAAGEVEVTIEFENRGRR